MKTEPAKALSVAATVLTFAMNKTPMSSVLADAEGWCAADAASGCGTVGPKSGHYTRVDLRKRRLCPTWSSIPHQPGLDAASERRLSMLGEPAPKATICSRLPYSNGEHNSNPPRILDVVMGCPEDGAKNNGICNSIERVANDVDELFPYPSRQSGNVALKASIRSARIHGRG